MKRETLINKTQIITKTIVKSAQSILLLRKQHLLNNFKLMYKAQFMTFLSHFKLQEITRFCSVAKLKRLLILFGRRPIKNSNKKQQQHNQEETRLE